MVARGKFFLYDSIVPALEAGAYTMNVSVGLDTSGDGVDATGTLSFGNGHYRLDWAANGSNAKQKTFWVACEAATGVP